MQVVEDRRFRDDSFKAFLRRGGSLTPDQKIDFADLRQVVEQGRQPDLADEPGNAYKKHHSDGWRRTRRRGRNLLVLVDEHRGGVIRGEGAHGGTNRPWCCATRKRRLRRFRCANRSLESRSCW